MMTPILFAVELMLVQQFGDENPVMSARQDAVLVVHEKTARGATEQVSVSIPSSEIGFPPVSLTELRSMVQSVSDVVQSPVMSFEIDRTIGGHPKGKGDNEGGDEGGIAGVGVPFDLQFVVTTGSIVPPAQMVQFTNAVEDVEAYIESHVLTKDVVLRIMLAYVALPSGRLGVTTARYSVEKFGDVAAGFEVINVTGDAFVLPENEINPVPLRASIPVRYSGVSTSATPENRIYVVRPLKLALGLPDPAGVGIPLDDGLITLSSAIQWDFDPSNGLQFGQSLLYSFQDHLIRELCQAMGFVAGADFLVRDCTVMDLFRFQQDVILEDYLVNNPANVFGGNPQVTCAQFSTYYEGVIFAGQNFSGALPGWALDYNPGLNKTLVSDAAAFGITTGQMLTAAGADTPNATSFLASQFHGILSGGNKNAFDDSELVAPLVIPMAQRTFTYPDGAAQTIVTAGAGAGKCVVVDFRGRIPAAGANPQINNDFLGAMPRTVARNSVANKSILNFVSNTFGVDFDFEMEMYDGSPVRGAFVKQDELADLGTRCLMGKAIGKGNTFYTRDICSYTLSPNNRVPLGTLADFLTRREWLALDAMGWNVDMSILDDTDEGDTEVDLDCP